MNAAIIALFPPHLADCPVCGGRGVVTLHALRPRAGVQVAVRVGRILRCPLMTGTDLLRAEVTPSAVPDGAA